MRWEVQSALIGAAGIVFSAGVSATAVIITQQLAEGRSERERQRVRESEEARRRDELALEEVRHLAARQQASEAHERSLEDRWRDERRDAHARLLSALDVHWTPVSRFISTLHTVEPDHVPERISLPQTSEEEQAELREAQSVVELIGSPAAVEAARIAVRTARITGWMARMGGYEAISYQQHRDEYYQALDAYRVATRRELGVEGSTPSSPQ